MKAWAEEELQYAELGDVRRKKRLIRIVSDLAAQPNSSVPQASGNLAATQAAYECVEISLHQTGSDRLSSPKKHTRTSQTIPCCHCDSGHNRTEFYPSSSQERHGLLGQCQGQRLKSSLGIL